MARSLTKIVVEVDGNVSGLRTAMGEASGSVNMLAKSQRNVQQATQQMVFAIDDAVASFGTGGLAGAIRGAANNLTTMAMMLGGVKIQLLAIGAIAAVQLGMTFLKNRQEDAKGLEERLKRVRDILADIKADIERRSSQRMDMLGVKDIKTSDEAVNRLKENGRKWAEEQQKINELREHAFRVAEELDEARGRKARGQSSDFELKRLELLEEEWANINRQGQQLQQNIDHHKEMNAELLNQLQMLDQIEARIEEQRRAEQAQAQDMQMRLDKMEMMRDAFKSLDDLAAELTDTLDPKQGRTDAIMRDVKRQIEEVNRIRGAGVISDDEARRLMTDIEDAAAKRIQESNRVAANMPLPGAMQAGSSGAVGAINSAIANSMNMRDANREAQQKNTQALDDLRKELQKAENNLVHIVPVL